MASGDPRMASLLPWTTGSTYRTTAPDAIVGALIASGAAACLPAMTRWLDILPLGAGSSRSLGLHLALSRTTVLIAIAVLTAAPTLLVGPLSFTGLIAPHMARTLGLRRPMSQIAGAALLGGLIMLTADWLGRTLLFPYQIPAGLCACLIGAPYMLVLTQRKAGRI